MVADPHARRFALSTFGTGGDIIPFARLARALALRGHRVTVHSWPLYRSWFPAGVDFVASGSGVTDEELDRSFEHALRAPTFFEQVRRFGALFYGLGRGPERARGHHRTARAAFAGHDLAVINALDHVAQAAAEDGGLPWVCYTSRPPPDPALADGPFAELDGEVTEVVAAVSGRRSRVRTFREASPLSTLVPCSAHLLPDPVAPPVALTGAWLEPPAPEPLGAELEAFLAGGPTLLVTFGTMPDVTGRTAALIAAAARSGWRALVQLLPPAAAPRDVPGGIAIVRERLPFAALLPRVAAVVHHGSVGTLHEVVRAARPSLVIPHMGDQTFWAAMLFARGLGPAPVMFTELDVPLLGERLAALRDAAYARRAGELGARVAVEDGVGDAARRLVALAEQRA